ncbi:MAG: hypothetical protein ACRDAI_03440 [Candidatus Rhabdochlamydia sp.]
MQISQAIPASYPQSIHCEDDLYNLDIELNVKNSHENVHMNESVFFCTAACPTALFCR